MTATADMQAPQFSHWMATGKVCLSGWLLRRATVSNRCDLQSSLLLRHMLVVLLFNPP
jgi:hypothetical protein